MLKAFYPVVHTVQYKVIFIFPQLEIFKVKILVCSAMFSCKMRKGNFPWRIEGIRS